MNAATFAYLVLVLAGFAAFIGVLGYYSLRTLLESVERRASDRRSRAPSGNLRPAR